MGKKIVVSFPGGRGSEIPLLYYSAKHFEDMGYEKVFVGHPMPGEDRLDVLINNAEQILKNIPWSEYEDIIFTAKSLGTLVACRIKEMFSLPASLILFTPLPDTLNYIHKDNNILLVAAGDRDKYLDAATLKNHCDRQNVPCHIELDVGHRMEVLNNLPRNLEIQYNTLKPLQQLSRRHSLHETPPS